MQHATTHLNKLQHSLTLRNTPGMESPMVKHDEYSLLSSLVIILERNFEELVVGPATVVVNGFRDTVHVET